MSVCLQLLTFLALFLSVSSQLDEGAQLRFDKILADFGFSQSSRATVRDPTRQDLQTKPLQSGLNNLVAFATDPQVRHGVTIPELHNDQI